MCDSHSTLPARILVTAHRRAQTLSPKPLIETNKKVNLHPTLMNVHLSGFVQYFTQQDKCPETGCISDEDLLRLDTTSAASYLAASRV